MGGGATTSDLDIIIYDHQDRRTGGTDFNHDTSKPWPENKHELQQTVKARLQDDPAFVPPAMRRGDSLDSFREYTARIKGVERQALTKAQGCAPERNLLSGAISDVIRIPSMAAL